MSSMSLPASAFSKFAGRTEASVRASFLHLLKRRPKNGRILSQSWIKRQLMRPIAANIDAVRAGSPRVRLIWNNAITRSLR
jgi:hypothetical protein